MLKEIYEQPDVIRIRIEEDFMLMKDNSNGWSRG
jgi:hypothetical protein